ncbi:hypothetical protein LS684_01315 [Cytobacillus spongiae]|uniref:hypothetical protein n=1 Tax=Cytobacillus spongiae TaxID=2901381 RepID=UPI001F34423A|nr:hypothetical protein [Cytobacillus spongiae]UII56172.1 hypothetical protein LS684_01315 [Cytobacillus spongiae]
MGGYYKVLPKKLRIISAIHALLLLFMGFVFLQHATILNGFGFLSTTILIWVITVFLGINTIANLISRSKKERMIMTPLSGLAFILCLVISLYYNTIS